MDFPFEIIRVPGAEALSNLAALRLRGDVYPVLLGNAENIEILLENYEFLEESTEELLGAAEEIDPDEWFSTRLDADPEYYEEERGEWPEDVQPDSTILGHIDLISGEPHPEVAIALVPSDAAWKVPCHLKFGGWNECPFPAEHSALMKRWQEKYGAEVVTISHDTVEMQVRRPPETREEAMALAREQFIYCADIVSQGTQTIEALAASLIKAPTWFFWWD